MCAAQTANQFNRPGNFDAYGGNATTAASNAPPTSNASLYNTPASYGRFVPGAANPSPLPTAIYHPALHGPPQNAVQQVIYQQTLAKARMAAIPPLNYGPGANFPGGNYASNGYQAMDTSNWSSSGTGASLKPEPDAAFPPAGGYSGPTDYRDSGAAAARGSGSTGGSNYPSFTSPNSNASPPLLPTYNASRNCLIMAPDSTGGSVGATGSVVSSDGDDTNSQSRFSGSGSLTCAGGRLKSKRSSSTGTERKHAPTIATGRRNLKNEEVEPDEAERRMKRRERNRRSAQKCRERKVQRTQELQGQVDALRMEANSLLRELDSWRAQAKHCIELLREHCPSVPVPALYYSCAAEDESLARQLPSRRASQTSLPPMGGPAGASEINYRPNEASGPPTNPADEPGGTAGSGPGGMGDLGGFLPSMACLHPQFRSQESIASPHSARSFTATSTGRQGTVSPTISNSTVSMMTPGGGQQGHNLSGSSSNSTGLCHIITSHSPVSGASTGPGNVATLPGGSSSSSSPMHYEMTFSSVNMDAKL